MSSFYSPYVRSGVATTTTALVFPYEHPTEEGGDGTPGREERALLGHDIPDDWTNPLGRE